jgi:hypothetical protein
MLPGGLGNFLTILAQRDRPVTFPYPPASQVSISEVLGCAGLPGSGATYSVPCLSLSRAMVTSYGSR